MLQQVSLYLPLQTGYSIILAQFCVTMVSPKENCVHLLSKGGRSKCHTYWKSFVKMDLNGFMTHTTRCFAACTEGGTRLNTAVCFREEDESCIRVGFYFIFNILFLLSFHISR